MKPLTVIALVVVSGRQKVVVPGWIVAPGPLGLDDIISVQWYRTEIYSWVETHVHRSLEGVTWARWRTEARAALEAAVALA